MTTEEDVTDYMIRAERSATGLRAAGEQITDNLIIAMILKGLPESYKPFVIVHTPVADPERVPCCPELSQILQK